MRKSRGSSERAIDQQLICRAAAREEGAQQERQRLARELHDSVCQALYGIQIGARTARERLDQDPARQRQLIDYIMRLAEAGEAEVRALIFELRPDSLEREGLVAALNKHIEALRASQCITAQSIAREEPEAPIGIKEALHGIAVEAIHNTAKHARANSIDVHLEASDHSVVLEIADDGVGFDPDGTFPGHLGLQSMRERAREVGGLLEVVSARGRGTRIVARVPLAS